MNCIIVDDDKLSVKIMQEFVERTQELKLLGTFSTAVDALAILNSPLSQPVDLIFLDIEMPQMSGIEFLGALNVVPQVIIYSSQEKYALESYEYDVTDYLLKPVDYERFLKALGRVEERIERKESPIKESTEIFIKNNSSLVRLKYDDILWVEAMENYVVLNTYTDKYTIHFTMKALAEKLPEDKFMRVHRSFIVNFTKVKSIEDNMLVIVYDKSTKAIPVGKSYKDKLMNDINIITK